MKKEMNGFWGSFVFTEARAETDFESVEPPTASPFHVSFEGLSLLSDFEMYPHIFLISTFNHLKFKFSLDIFCLYIFLSTVFFLVGQAVDCYSVLLLLGNFTYFSGEFR